MNLVLMGVAGSGKTTIGRRLARRLGKPWRFYDADRFHPPANIEKMSRGVPLDDADRAPWLKALRAHLDARAARGENAILACSALKETYRRKLAGADGATRFIHLRGDYAAILARLRGRRRHYFKEDMLRGQFDAMEEPAPGAALVIDATLSPAEIVERILRELGSP